MKKITYLIVLAVMTVMTFSVNVKAASGLSQYRQEARKIEKRYGLKVVDTSKLTYRKITHRKGRVIVERCIGKVTNSKRDGRILNSCKSLGWGDYISYRGVKCRKGNIVITYYIWNPENNIEDDTIARWDYVIK